MRTSPLGPRHADWAPNLRYRSRNGLWRLKSRWWRLHWNVNLHLQPCNQNCLRLIIAGNFPVVEQRQYRKRNSCNWRETCTTADTNVWFDEQDNKMTDRYHIDGDVVTQTEFEAFLSQLKDLSKRNWTCDDKLLWRGDRRRVWRWRSQLWRHIA